MTSVAFTPDSKRIVTAEGLPGARGATREDPFFSGTNAVRVWEISPKRQVAAFTTLSNAVTSVAVAPDGKMIAAGDSDGNVRVWRMPR